MLTFVQQNCNYVLCIEVILNMLITMTRLCMNNPSYFNLGLMHGNNPSRGDLGTPAVKVRSGPLVSEAIPTTDVLEIKQVDNYKRVALERREN